MRSERHTRGACASIFFSSPDVVYLNHGAFGACPRPVFERYQAWQRELEREPTQFIARKLPGLLEQARASLGAFVGADANDLTFVQNAGTGVNMAARALGLQPGDEVLATDLEYGACDLMWQWLCERTGAHYIRAEIGELFEHRSERTRAVFLSHITSETALLLPVEEIIAKAREEGLVTDRRRRACGRTGESRPLRARRRLLRRELPQVAVRAEGLRLSPRRRGAARPA